MNTKLEIKTAEMHNGGNAMRVIHSGFPEIKGHTILEKQKYCKEHLDKLRKLLVLEPRGHAALVAILLVQPDAKGADVAILLLDNARYMSMCGDAVITISRYAIDAGIVKNPTSPTTKINIQLPCGVVQSRVEYNGEKTGKVAFSTVPAFALALDKEVPVEGFGNVKVDVGYGGSFYAIVSGQQFGLEPKNGFAQQLMHAGAKVQAAVSKHIKIHHPEKSELSFLYGVIFTDGNDSLEQSRHVVTYGEEIGQIVRSPCGSATTSRIAVQHAKGLMNEDQCKTFESGISGCTFTGEIQKVTKCGEYKAVVVEICGQGSHVVGESTFILENTDEFQEGLSIE